MNTLPVLCSLQWRIKVRTMPRGKGNLRTILGLRSAFVYIMFYTVLFLFSLPFGVLFSWSYFSNTFILHIPTWCFSFSSVKKGFRAVLSKEGFLGQQVDICLFSCGSPKEHSPAQDCNASKSSRYIDCNVGPINSAFELKCRLITEPNTKCCLTPYVVSNVVVHYHSTSAWYASQHFVLTEKFSTWYAIFSPVLVVITSDLWLEY